MNLDELKVLAKQSWLDGDHEGNNADYYYFEHGFIAGLRHGYYLNEKRLESLQKLSDLNWLPDGGWVKWNAKMKNWG
jgi:hypothetical protein